MGTSFADSLKSLRVARGLSQQQLASRLFVDRSTVARWESGDRMPDLAVVPRIALCLDVDAAALLNVLQEGDAPEIIVVDDERIALSGAVAVLESMFPAAAITGFNRPSDALSYAKDHPIAIAFLDIEMRRTSGLDVCHKLLDVCPYANVIFLTAHREYSFDAWNTEACGFLLKPITSDAVHAQLNKLRHPVADLLVESSHAPTDHV